jgi:hypothetical protein
MTEERNYEEEARKEGWVPQEEWGRDPDEWKPAKDFVETGEKINGILKKKLSSLESRIQEAEEANRKFGEYHKQTIQQEKQRSKQTIQELQTQLARAVSDADGQEYLRLQGELDNAKRAEASLPSEEKEWNDMSNRWISQNPWYQSNQKLSIFADGISDRVRAEGYTGQAYFSELTRRVQDNFPEEFENKNKERANAVETSAKPSGSQNNPKKRTYNDLPPDAKKACSQFVKEGFMTQDEYLKNYGWDEE